VVPRASPTPPPPFLADVLLSHRRSVRAFRAAGRCYISGPYSCEARDGDEIAAARGDVRRVHDVGGAVGDIKGSQQQ